MKIRAITALVILALVLSLFVQMTPVRAGEEDNQELLRKIEQVLKNQEKILEELALVKQELAVVKVRASKR